MLLMRTDDDGELLWQRTYGSPWSDNAAFATELPSGRIVLAGAERASANVQKRPVLYMLEADGDEVWTVLFDERTESAVFYAIPLLMEDGGFAISGRTERHAPRVAGRTDSLGELLWKRWYSTNDAIDNYTYDVRRTLDGGFILAGTAFDSAFRTPLGKVDSFGCLIPGCQVFDGLEEQVTDLRDALEVFPNPASDQTNVRITLPVGTKRGNLRLPEGKLVQEGDRLIAGTHVLDPAAAHRGSSYLLGPWLSGTKVVVE
ncbi:MAG: hypothetical protein IPI41_18985 [Flavobacteriales bacterium]|nr:hypothetical protein [Flavobacteriales bacterium]